MPFIVSFWSPKTKQNGLAVFLQNFNVTVPFVIRVQELNHRIRLLNIRRSRFITFKKDSFLVHSRYPTAIEALPVRCYMAVPLWSSELNRHLTRSTRRFNAQHVKDFLITSAGNLAQASRIHCKTVLVGTFRFLAAGSSFIPTMLSHLSYFSVHEDLNALFQLTSGAWMYLVQPPGTITRSIFSKDVNPGGGDRGTYHPTFWTEGDTYIIIPPPPLFAKFMTTEA